MAASNMQRGCRFLVDVVLADDSDGFLPDELRRVLKDFAYAYKPRLSVTSIICRRGGEVTITLTFDSDAAYDACLTACARTAFLTQSLNAVDALDVCRRECRSAVDDVMRRDIEAGAKLLRDLLKKANITHKVDRDDEDVDAVIKLWLTPQVASSQGH